MESQIAANPIHTCVFCVMCVTHTMYVLKGRDVCVCGRGGDLEDARNRWPGVFLHFSYRWEGLTSFT